MSSLFRFLFQSQLKLTQRDREIIDILKEAEDSGAEFIMYDNGSLSRTSEISNPFYAEMMSHSSHIVAR